MHSGNKLDNLRSKIGRRKATLDTIIYQLAKELHCLGDIIGREYELVYKDGKLVGMVQKPIRTNKFMALIREAKADSERQERKIKLLKSKK